MTLVEHLYELRYRLGVALVAVLIGAVFGFWWFSHPFLGVRSLGDLLTGPYCQLPRSVRFEPTPGQCQLLQTEPFEALMMQLKVGVAIGAVVFSPVWLYQFWAFITPGLYANERRIARAFVSIAVVLFTAGAVLAYYIVPRGLGFLSSFGGGTFVTALSASNYVNFVLVMLVIFGVSFELPLVIVMLNRIGVLSYARLKSWWRGIVFVLFVFAAIVTPQDPFSMLALAVALAVLFGFSMLICRAQDRRKERKLREEGLAGLDPDEASDVDLSSAPVDEPAQYDETT